MIMFMATRWYNQHQYMYLSHRKNVKSCVGSINDHSFISYHETAHGKAKSSLVARYGGWNSMSCFGSDIKIR